MAFSSEGVRDTLVVEAGEREGIYLAQFDMNEIRTYRHTETWGNAFRRPRQYNLITAPEVEEPFIRVNTVGERWDRTRRQS